MRDIVSTLIPNKVYLERQRGMTFSYYGPSSNEKFIIIDYSLKHNLGER
jgi:hypothetical protein